MRPRTHSRSGNEITPREPYDEYRFISEFFESRCTSPEGTVDRLAEILRIRGFLVEKNEEGSYQLNGFSTSRDIKDFESLMSENDESRLNQLFRAGSVQNYEVCHWTNLQYKDLFGSNRRYGDKVDTLSLEPFVARYCKSLALIGVHTYLSCDGWHSRRGSRQRIRVGGTLRIGFSDMHSFNWMKILHANDPYLQKLSLRFNVSNDETWTIPLGSVERRMRIYSQLNEAAETIYAHRFYYREIKADVVNSLKGIRKKGISNEEAYNILLGAFFIALGKRLIASPNEWRSDIRKFE